MHNTSTFLTTLDHFVMCVWCLCVWLCVWCHGFCVSVGVGPTNGRPTSMNRQHQQQSASRCCENSPHDDPSCLCGSFEDQVLKFGAVFPEQDLKRLHVVYSTVLLITAELTAVKQSL